MLTKGKRAMSSSYDKMLDDILLKEIPKHTNKSKYNVNKKLSVYSKYFLQI